MRNRAKCRLCGDIVESFHPTDLCICKCGEIGVYGAEAMYAQADNFENFLRVDDVGNEICVTYRGKSDEEQGDQCPANPPKEIARDELIYELDTMIENIKNLPEHAKFCPPTNRDLAAFMLVISNILKRV